MIRLHWAVAVWSEAGVQLALYLHPQLMWEDFVATLPAWLAGRELARLRAERRTREMAEREVSTR